MKPRAFTLVELLVVIVILALLMAMLLPSLSRAKDQARVTVCLTREKQAGAAIYLYSSDFQGSIPYGPKAPPPTPINFYPVTGTVTSLISLGNGQPVALGLLLKPYLSMTPMALFCPGIDYVADAQAELDKVGITQAECSYYYRHASGGSLTIPPGTGHINLSNLGVNTTGFPISALMIDANQTASPSLAMFGVLTRTNHQAKTVNILFSDGHAATVGNQDGAYTVNLGSNPHAGFALILQALELADHQQ